MNQIRIRIEYRDADGSHHAWEYPQEGYIVNDVEYSHAEDYLFRGIVHKGKLNEVTITQETVGNFGFKNRPFHRVEKISFDLTQVKVTWIRESE